MAAAQPVKKKPMTPEQLESGLFWRFDAGVTVKLAAAIINVSYGALKMAVSRGKDKYFLSMAARSEEEREGVEIRILALCTLLPRSQFLEGLMPLAQLR